MKKTLIALSIMALSGSAFAYQGVAQGNPDLLGDQVQSSGHEGELHAGIGDSYGDVTFDRPSDSTSPAAISVGDATSRIFDHSDNGLSW